MKLVAALLTVVAASKQACPPFDGTCCHINPSVDPSYTEYRSDPSKQVPGWGEVDLDLPPAERWTHVVAPLAKPLQTMVFHFKRFLGKASKVLFDLVVDSEKFKEIAQNVLDYLGEYGEEMRGVAKATGVPEEEIFFFNMIYEVEGGCTSIVAQDPAGNLVHGRNLDFGLLFGEDWEHLQWTMTEDLRPLLTNVRFVKGGKVLFNSTVFAGYIGLLTGAKEGGFSVTVNSRKRLVHGWQPLLDYLYGTDRSGQFLTLMLREAMVQNHTYDEALERFKTTKLLGPAYIILGGTKMGEGAIVTRDPTSVAATFLLSDAAAKGRNSIVQTNWDIPHDPWFDSRRVPAEKCLSERFKDHIDFRNMFEVLSAHPNRNRLTTYTALMSTQTGAFESYLQFCDQLECAPWMAQRAKGMAELNKNSTIVV